MMRLVPASLLAGLLLLTACAATAATGAESKKPTAVASVDLEKYMGRWYEVARYPNSYQKGTVGVVAHYQLRDNGRITLKNSAFKKTLDGKVKKGSGSGKVVRNSDGAKWDVTFIWPFTADYWIIELDPEYAWAVVGQPSRKNLWILSRSPKLEDEVYADIIKRLEKHGYDASKLELTPQPADGPTFKPGEDGRA
jgi:apolipoprotein D and lipocalin family protein